MQLQDIRQRVACHYLIFQKIEARAKRHGDASESAHRPQGLGIFYDDKKANSKASEVGGVSI